MDLDTFRKTLKKDNRGLSMLGFIIVFPFIIMFCVDIILCGAYFMKQNDLFNIVNKKLDRALVVGQFTTTLKSDLENELIKEGFDLANTEIVCTPAIAYDDSNSTYAPRETEIEIKVVHKKPHAFYYINKAFVPSLSESKFYIGTKISGMSEEL